MSKKKNNKEENKSVSQSLLDSYRQVLMKVQEYFESVNNRKFTDDNFEESMKIIQSVLSAGEKLGKNIETLQILEKKVATEEMNSSKRRGTESTSMFEI